MKNYKNIIHIGGNKTGSTSLQKHLFSKHPLIYYLGEDCKNYSQIKNYINCLIRDDSSYYNHDELVDKFKVKSNNNYAALVFSSEDIMTSPLPSVCADRLKKILPNAEIVMVIRNQLTTWLSWYANHGAYLKWVPYRYWRRHVKLDEWLYFCFAYPRQTPVEAMNYYRFFRIFEERFGRNNIHVLMYEELLNDSNTYYKQWADIIGINLDEILLLMQNKIERKRVSYRKYYFDRLMSKMRTVPFLFHLILKITTHWVELDRWIESGPPLKLKLPSNWEKNISEYYRTSNKNIELVTGLDLNKYGYPL